MFVSPSSLIASFSLIFILQGDSNPFDHQIYGSDGQDLTCCDQYAWTKPIPGEYLSMKMKRRSKTKFDWEFHLTGDK